eukprot:6173546-Pleurochrysis_carterae.AAC.1
MSPDPRLMRRRTPKRASRSGRAPKATAPSGIEADDVLSSCRPQNSSSEWEEERRGPDLLIRTPKSPRPETSRSQVPIEEGSEGVSAVPVLSGMDTADTPTKLSSHDLHLLEQTREVLKEIRTTLATSPSVALDREAPFGGEGRGSGIPLTFSSGIGTQGISRARARTFGKLPPQSGLERRKKEG